MRKIPPDFHAFSVQYEGVVNKLITKVGIAQAFDPKMDRKLYPPVDEQLALWDTGATQSVITPKIVRDLGLKPVGKMVMHHGGGRTEQLTYMVNVGLPNGVGFPGVMVAELEQLENSEFGMLIGMDIIAVGDFSITCYEGKTCFSYRYPSKTKVDYVQEHRSIMRGVQGPNELCYCGSNTKFKKCHGARS